ncbi:uncharacterized protein EDB91DRAFT_1090353 [Suillus paluster]|uniref:uncharacterized protein n=1 Tax=Suillus paluster TaxID=48578 RepID=UPI001B86F583|nr:uncharacterized protein EDB91DRAFT_1090353 [Suillus paluster]KAG1718052.1 hypothetical protein EDB91DRAFT_1090353 [Suillus paluster]
MSSSLASCCHVTPLPEVVRHQFTYTEITGLAHYLHASMNPSCQFREWSAHDLQKLIRVQGTIEDVDGECSLKISGQRQKGCRIVAHYRLPLQALNKKCGVYRKIVTHLTGLPGLDAADMLNTYASVMEYMNNVRIAFLKDASRSEDALHGDFQSPALDYYLWLDHTQHGFHAEYRDALERDHNVTFEAIQNGRCADILLFVDWRVYHKQQCKDHDVCGAIQGCGPGEDIEHLLRLVEASMNDIDQAHDPGSNPECMEEPGTETGVIEAPSNRFPPFPLPFDLNCRQIALKALGGSGRQLLIRGFGRWLPSHIAMRMREIQGLDHNDSLENLLENGLLMTARTKEEFFEVFGMVEMMTKCQSISIDRGEMAKFFSGVGHYLYMSRQGSECSLEYGLDIGLSIEHQSHLDLSKISRPSIHSLGLISDSGAPMNVDTQEQSRTVTSPLLQRGSALPVPEEYTSLVYGSVNRALAHIGVQTDFDIHDQRIFGDYTDRLSNAERHANIGIQAVCDVAQIETGDVPSSVQPTDDTVLTDFMTLNGGDNPGIDTPGCHRHADVAMLDWKCDPTIPVMVQADIDFMEYSQQSHINVSDGTTHAVDTAADRPYDSGSLQSTDDLVFTGFSDPDDAQDIPTETYDASLQSTDDLVFTGFSDPDNAQDVPTDTHYGNCISKLECKPSMITPNEHCNIMDFAGCLISSRTNNSYSSGISAMVTFDGSDPCSQPSTSMSEGALVNKEPSIYIEARSQESIDVATSPPLKSRLRDRMKQKPTGKMPVTRHPTLQPTRPVLFAAKRNTIRQKVKPTNRKSNKNKYTLQDLVDETLAQLNDTPSTPCRVHSYDDID